MNEVINAMLRRRSCRSFKPDTVPQELIEQVVEAGLFAASGGGRQGTVIVAVSDKETRDMLSRLNSKYDDKKRPDPFYGAPVILAVLSDKSTNPTFMEDGSLAIGNMLLAAHALGLGSCWIHRAKPVFEDEEAKALLKKLGLEGDYVGIGHCALGYAKEADERIPARKEGRVYRVY